MKGDRSISDITNLTFLHLTTNLLRTLFKRLFYREGVCRKVKKYKQQFYCKMKIYPSMHR